MRKLGHLPFLRYEIFPVINGLTGNPTYIYIGAQVMPPQYEVLLRYQREGDLLEPPKRLEIMQNKTCATMASGRMGLKRNCT